jgi:hypothetical protein
MTFLNILQYCIERKVPNRGAAYDAWQFDFMRISLIASTACFLSKRSTVAVWLLCAKVEGKVADYRHPHPIPKAIMEEKEPIFKDLRATELLQRCFKHCTQNSNESFSNKVWSLYPKTSNFDYEIVNIAICDAVVTWWYYRQTKNI